MRATGYVEITDARGLLATLHRFVGAAETHVSAMPPLFLATAVRWQPVPIVCMRVDAHARAWRTALSMPRYKHGPELRFCWRCPCAQDDARHEAAHNKFMKTFSELPCTVPCRKYPAQACVKHHRSVRVSSVAADHERCTPDQALKMCRVCPFSCSLHCRSRGNRFR